MTKITRITQLQRYTKDLLHLFFFLDTSDYQIHYGKKAYHKYNITRVSTSPAATAIASISKSALDPKTIKRLRDKATIVCDKLADVSNCTNRTCLFDVYNDPCETTDLYATNPKVRF